MTEKLYYSNPSQSEFSAEITDKQKEKSLYAVRLDKTCFYPEGGGQPHDTGTIAGIPVIKVIKKEDDVLHYLKEDPGEGSITGKVDWNHRFDYMQQHTGQHIISAVLKKGGLDTVSVHQGTEYTTIEIAEPEISKELLQEIEAAANREVGMNKPVQTYWVREHEIKELDLRREPKVGGKIRIVEISGLDRVACGGVHLERTGDTGLIKEIGHETIRGNIRIYWKIGTRAFADYRMKTQLVNGLKTELSAVPEDIAQKVRSMKEQLLEKDRIIREKNDILADLTAEMIIKERQTDKIICDILREKPKELLKTLTANIAAEAEKPVCLINELEESFQWCIAVPETSSFDLNKHRKELLELISGKGGGKHPQWQGIGTNSKGIHSFFNQVKERITST
ncbi:MAG: alanyl-tRNA editing protein [Spirochaetia bacterium]